MISRFSRSVNRKIQKRRFRTIKIQFAPNREAAQNAAYKRKILFEFHRGSEKNLKFPIKKARRQAGFRLSTPLIDRLAREQRSAARSPTGRGLRTAVALSGLSSSSVLRTLKLVRGKNTAA